MGFPGGSDGKESACNAGDPGLIPALERSSGEGNSNPLQYFYLENSLDRGAWRATVHGVTKSWTQTTEGITYTHRHTYKNVTALGMGVLLLLLLLLLLRHFSRVRLCATS